MSPTSEQLDRGEKFTLYRLLDSLREYVLIWQDRRRVELFTKTEEGGWVSTVFDDASDTVSLRSLDCELTVGDIYQKVLFA